MINQNILKAFIDLAGIGVPANIFNLSQRHKKMIILYSLTHQNYHTEFSTGTVFSWEHIFANDDFKNILLSSFQWLENQRKYTINAFVLMLNHIHLLWKILDGFERKVVEGAFFCFTTHEFKRCLKKDEPMHMEKHFVNNSDR